MSSFHVTFSKTDFDEIVYPAVAMTTADDLVTLNRLGRILDKLEKKGHPNPNHHGVGPVFYQQRSEAATYTFDEAEAEALQNAVEALIPRLAAIRARDIPPLLKKLDGHKATTRGDS